MNYANMIEEKQLKKGFIIATLVSTIVGTISVSMGLHDRVQEKRDRKKQKALDGGQDREIEQLKQKVDKIERGGQLQRGERKKSQRSRSTSRSSSSRYWARHRDDEDEDGFTRSARRSKAMIERMYDDHFSLVGQDYARGDVITENRLQAQIIQLQQTVINVLQDALYSGRRLTGEDVERLIRAQTTAREGSLDALQDQYSRMLANRRALPRQLLESPPNNLLIEDVPGRPQRQATFPMRSSSTRSPSLPPQRQATFPARSSTTRSPSLPPQRAQTISIPPPTFFCRYSEDLQHGTRALSSAFSPLNDCRCPACSVVIPVDTRDVWVFSTQLPIGKGETQKIHEYRMGARFVVKCHMDDGRFLCVLCNRFRDADCICRSVEALVKHVGNSHTADEYEKDADLTRMKNGELAPS